MAKTGKAGKKRLITAEDLYDFRIVSEARIAPDGAHTIFAVQRVDRKTEKKYTNLFLANNQSGEVRQFTYGDQGDSRPRWSPDGSEICFVSNRLDKEKPGRLFLIPFGGGEARPISDIKGEIGSFYWSPDGSKILLHVRKTDQEVLDREADEQKKKLGVVSRHINRVFYKLDGYGYLPKERTHLWVLDVKTGKAKQITDGTVHDERGGTWSPDGKWIAFVSNRAEMPDLNPDMDELYVIPAKGGEMRKIATPQGSKYQPSFSSDGKWIAYYGQDGVEEWYRNNELWIVPADGTGEAKNLTAAYDLHCDAGTINDLGGADQMSPCWSKDGKWIMFQAVIHGSTVLYRINVDDGKLEAIIGEGGVVASFDYSADQQWMAYLYGTMNSPAEVYLLDLNTGKPRQISKINQDLLEAVDLGTIEEVWYKGPVGNDLQGWILKPPSFDPGNKYPSILEIHGGPLTQYGNFMMHEFYYLAAQGYVVHFTNPRGGRGYGEEHAGAIWGGWGDADYADLMAWTDYVATLPYIDTERMGVTGGSYGGYMTVWIIGHTQRFKAAVTQRCVSNFISMWGSSDFNWSFQHALGNVTPFEDVEKHWNHSPIKYIGNAKTPTLVIHNENDMRCPIEQGEQVFVALQRLGIPSEMVRFPDEPHGLSRIGRTDRRITRLNHILRWFNQYL